MTSLTRQYNTAARQARTAVEKTADLWTQRARSLADRRPDLPQLDLVPAVERYFDFVQRTVDRNRDLAVKWAQAASALPGAVREQAESAGEIARDKAARTELAAHEHAERATHELAREAAKIEREQARKAQAVARKRYEGLTKTQLSDLLAQRDLPKTGNVDQLVDRLVEADNS
ncbi:MAG TPA: SAP domain-containing protein [Streptosporangiaceae bacterium]|nr:SAP domain-containing protein [Streptosporangiaceae bacterium]